MSNASSPGQLRTSVLICTAGRPHLLHRALTSLSRGSELPDQLVIVNGGDAQANRVVEEYTAEFREVVLVQYRNRNLSTSRNIGLNFCDGDLLALTDDDAEVDVHWISRIRQSHEADPKAGAIGGPAIGSRSDRFLSRLADKVVFPAFAERRIVRTIPGVNASYKVGAVRSIGGFDETLFRGEDVDFNWRLTQLGLHVVYEPSITVRHEHRATFASLLQQQYMYGRAYVLVRRKWPEMYCVYPHRFSTFRDWAKLVHSIVAVVYQPALLAARMSSPGERLGAYPMLVAHHAIWKFGMLREALTSRHVASGVQSASTTPNILLHRRWVRGEIQPKADMSAPVAGTSTVGFEGEGISADRG